MILVGTFQLRKFHDPDLTLKKTHKDELQKKGLKMFSFQLKKTPHFASAEKNKAKAEVKLSVKSQ